MTIKLTPASFLAGVKQSGLIEQARFDAMLEDMQRSGVNTSDASAIAAAFIARRALSEWQAEKLLQGRHKGFILGRYRLLSLLGAGEMSAVYLAEHMMMERRCAIKVLPANKVADTSYLGRFHREARAVAALNHVNIVKAYDVDKQIESGTEIHFLVMEYVDGKNLNKLVQELGPLDYVSAVDYIRQAAEGLQHAHTSGLIHRDIKPENLLIDGQGIVKLLDLGLARFFNASDEESLTIKHDEKVLGTADYLAPEQAIDSHKVDLRADVYSLGCSLYYAISGHPPFTEGSLVQRLMAHQTKKPPSVKYDRPDCPDDLVAILEKLMAKRPADRYQTAAEASQALGQWLVAHGHEAWRQKNLGLVAMLGPQAAPNSGEMKSIFAAEPSPPPAPAVVTPPVKAAEAIEETPPAPPVKHTSPVLKDRPTATPRPVGRGANDSGPRRTVAAKSQPLPVVRRSEWDWEKTLTVGLLSLGTVLVVMIGVWLFGNNQNQLANTSSTTVSPTATTVDHNEPPLTSERPAPHSND